MCLVLSLAHLVSKQSFTGKEISTKRLNNCPMSQSWWKPVSLAPESTYYGLLFYITYVQSSRNSLALLNRSSMKHDQNIMYIVYATAILGMSQEKAAIALL
jgi:hypothetical protein